MDVVEEESYVIKIREELTEEVSTLRPKRNEDPSTDCCIYRIPPRFSLINGKKYKPKTVSIGPYHWNNETLMKNNDLKLQCLESMLSRTKAYRKTIDDYIKSIKQREPTARQCYSGAIKDKDKNRFLKTMIVDGCFILELFREYGDPRLFKSNDPLAMKVPYLYKNLLRLDCQIPFFVIQQLFDISNRPDRQEPPNSQSLCLLALRFFNNVMKRRDKDIERYAKRYDNPKNSPPLHLLDLVRSSLIPPGLPLYLVPPENEGNTQSNTQPNTKRNTQSIPCISKLRRAGIEVSPNKKTGALLDVKFEHGVIEMPTITISAFMKLLVRNCVAFEQCHNSIPKYFTVYATFLDCLVTAPDDVRYLRDRDVIDNYLASDGQVADVINQLGKEVLFDNQDFYLSKLFNDVEEYYENKCHVQWTSFKKTYFNTPWSFISALAAFVLLLLTLAQTFFAVISYVHPK